MKKTTIYLREEELKELRKKAFLMNKSVAELIRLGIKIICSPSSKKEGKILMALEKIRDKFRDLSEGEIEDLAESAKESVRSGKSRR